MNDVPILTSRASATPRSFGGAVEAWLSSLNDRHREVILRRLAGFNGRVETLREIAVDFGVKHQRVKQLETIALKRSLKAGISPFADDVILGVRSLGGAAPMYEVEASSSRLDGLCEYSWLITAYRRLKLASFSDITVERHQGINWVIGLSETDWGRHRTKARNTVSVALSREQVLHRSDAETLVRTHFPINYESAAKVALNDILSDAVLCCDSKIVSLSSSTEAKIRAVLIDAGEPLHYSDVYERFQDCYEFEGDVRTIHNALRMSDSAFLLGRGTYGLAEHVRIGQNAQKRLADEVVQIISASSSTRQWHAQELLEAARERGVDLPSSATVYDLCCTIEIHAPEIRSLGRMVYQSADAPEATRIDYEEAVVSILRDARHPLADKEIIERMGEYRGVSRFTKTLAPSDRYARLPDGRIGLLDRDFGITEDRAELEINDILAHCNATQKGAHESELRRVLPLGDEFSDLFVAGLVAHSRRSPRLSISVAGYIYPSSWDGPRRLSTTEALDALASQFPDTGWTLVEITQRVQHLTGRCDLSEAALGMRLAVNEGAQYSRTLRLWFLKKSDS